MQNKKSVVVIFLLAFVMITFFRLVYLQNLKSLSQSIL